MRLRSSKVNLNKKVKQSNKAKRELGQENIKREFDPGSGRTLAACLTHASRTKYADPPNIKVTFPSTFVKEMKF